MAKEKEKLSQLNEKLSWLIEKFREMLDELVDDDGDGKTRGILLEIDQTLGLIERNIADLSELEAEAP